MSYFGWEKRVLLLFVLLIIGAFISISAEATQYVVETYSDLCNAIKHATSGDTILFNTSSTLNLLNLQYSCEYHNENGNGQYFAYGMWGFYNITITLKAVAGEKPKLIGASIVFNNADGSVLQGLTIDRGISVVGGTDGITIYNNTFLGGSFITIDGGSGGYVIQNNYFQGGGGIRVYDVTGTTPGAVNGNFVDGKPIVYMESESCGEITGDIGQAVVFGCTSGVNIHDIDFGSSGSAIPIIISHSSNVVIRGIGISYNSIIEIYKSSQISVRDSTLQNVFVYVTGSNGVMLENNIINTNSSFFRLMALSVVDSSDLQLKYNKFTYYSQLLYARNITGVTIEANEFYHNSTLWGLELKGCSNIKIYSNNFTTIRDLSGYSEPYIYIKPYTYRTYIANIGVEIKNNTFTTSPAYNSRGDREAYMEGANINDATNVSVEHNYFEWTNGVSVYNSINTTITNNEFRYIYFPIIVENITNVSITGNKGEEILLGEAIHIEELRNAFIGYNNFSNFALPADFLSISKDNYNVTIAGNIFENSDGGDIIFSAYRNGDVHIYMNAFINVSHINSIFGIVEGYSYPTALDNDTFRSPEQITYTYNGNTFTGYVGNYYEGYSGSDNNNDGIGDTPQYLGFFEKTYSNYVDLYDLYPIIDINIVYQWMNLTQTLPPESGSQQGQEGGEGGVGGEETINQTVPVFNPLTPKQREAMEEAKNVDLELKNITQKLAHMNVTENEIMEALDSIGLEKTIQDLYNAGVIKVIPKMTDDEKRALREILTSMYGPMLENYPTTIGRLYLLYIIYY